VQRSVLFALVLREMKARVGGQWVGALWTLIEPLTHTLILVSYLGFLRGAADSGIEYPVFLVTGLLPFFLFQNLSTRLMDGVESNRGLFSYRQVKPFDTLVSRAVVETLMTLLVYAFSLGILGWLGYSVLPSGPLEALGVNALLILLGTGLGTFYAVVGHDRPRLRSFIRMTNVPLYLISGVIFQVDLLPREYLDWLLLNPILHLVELSRHAFIPAYMPVEGINAGYPLLFTMTVFTLALLAYRADRRRLVTVT
jgi:capsular polysaccharide transport system permease protein